MEMSSKLSCPFDIAHQLEHMENVEKGVGQSTQPDLGPGRILPGHPLISLGASERLGTFLEHELCCDDLERMAPHLWVMSTQSSASVRPLHDHRLLGRQILITESPRLHLVWFYDRFFVKPLPRYLLSHSFWTTYLLRGAAPSSLPSKNGDTSPSPTLPSSEILLGGVPGRAEKIRRAALGFIRTYRYLIRHESDHSIALDLGLIPAGTTWEQFCAFVSRFEDSITDADVSGRYHYGDLRLTRLNFYSLILLRKSRYLYMPEQYSAYFARHFATLLFIFAAVSAMLSAMQIEMAAAAQETMDSKLFEDARAVYRWFSLLAIFLVSVISVYLLAKVIYRYLSEWAFALRVKWRLQREQVATKRRASEVD